MAYPDGSAPPAPPSYRTNVAVAQGWASDVPEFSTQSHVSREDTPLLPAKPRGHRFRFTFGAAFALGCILVSVMLAIVCFQVSTSWQRSSWDHELKQHDQQRARMDRERIMWQENIRKYANESTQIELQRARWDHERDLWKIERERWAEEKRQRSVHQPFWGAPRRLDRCLTYGTREYTAKLYNILTTEDWAEKCKKTAIEIKGRTHTSPSRCEDHGSDEGIHGFWLVDHDELECEPTWERFKRGDCDHLPGHRRWESILWNIRSDDSDMFEMCRSTPVTLPTGHHFATSKCEDRRRWGPNDWRGWIGKWDVPDPACRN